MRASNDVYKAVAENCSSFSPVRDSFSSSASDEQEVSCRSCRHFDGAEYCELDLYDPIVANRNING